jgi:hypothetical protein
MEFLSENFMARQFHFYDEILLQKKLQNQTVGRIEKKVRKTLARFFTWTKINV